MSANETVEDVVRVEHSHVRWPRGLGFPVAATADDGTVSDRFFAALHRIKVRLPNDDFVSDEAVTLEEMRAKGAV